MKNEDLLKRVTEESELNRTYFKKKLFAERHQRGKNKRQQEIRKKNSDAGRSQGKKKIFAIKRRCGRSEGVEGVVFEGAGRSCHWAENTQKRKKTLKRRALLVSGPQLC